MQVMEFHSKNGRVNALIPIDSFGHLSHLMETTWRGVNKNGQSH